VVGWLPLETCMHSLVQEGESLAGESLAGRSAAGTHYSRASRADSRLDRDLQDAIEMVKVSDTKIGALRKMHAQYLLRRWAPETCARRS